MRFVLLTVILSLYVAEGVKVVQVHDAGYWASFAGNIATVVTVLWAMGRWGKKQAEYRAERRQEHEQEMAAKSRLYAEIVSVYRQLAPVGKPSIIARMEEMETRVGRVEIGVEEIRRIVHPGLPTPPTHPGDMLVDGEK